MSSTQKKSSADEWIKKNGNPLLPTQQTTSSQSTPAASQTTRAKEDTGAYARYLQAQQASAAKQRTYSGSYMGNTNDMYKALNGNLVNNGQKSSIRTTGSDSFLRGDTGTDPGFSYGAFAPSQTYLAAMDYTNQLLAQLSSGRTSYTDKINDLMDRISNRDPFSYDADTDPLFQSQLQSSMAAGKVAMQDTMGAAAGLTGGYGSTYATSAANQAYNSYIQDAYSNLPDYYNMALEAYNSEGQRMYNELGMYQTADEAEYGRMANAYAMNADMAARMYDREMDAYNSALNSQYKNYQAAQEQSNWEKEYNLSLLKTTADIANKSGSNLDYSSAYKRVVATANKYGPESNELYDTISLLGNQGYDPNDLLDYALGNSDSASYSWNIANGKYTDQWGGMIDDAPIFQQVGEDKWVDQYGREYTKAQKKAIEKQRK